jgi:uncharacterized caspase-like protein
VIGNGSYAQAPLGGATSDARSVADALREGGFDVVFAEDTRKTEIEESIARFARTVERGAIAVVYFSGYAVQHRGRNFLLPVDAKIASEADVQREAIDVDLILDPLIVARPTGSVVILDASRSRCADRGRGSCLPGRAWIGGRIGRHIFGRARQSDEDPGAEFREGVSPHPGRGHAREP